MGDDENGWHLPRDRNHYIVSTPYIFGGRNFQQVKGGPIGTRLTMAIARIIMKLWRRKVKEHLKATNIDVLVEGGYVDDMRHLISMLEAGWRWDQEKDSFCYKDVWKQEDQDVSRKAVTEREVLRMMNGVFNFLEFTKETQ